MGEYIEQFRFRDRSVTTLANNVLKMLSGEIIKSLYNVGCFKIVDSFKPNVGARDFEHSHSHREHQKEISDATG